MEVEYKERNDISNVKYAVLVIKGNWYRLYSIYRLEIQRKSLKKGWCINSYDLGD